MPNQIYVDSSVGTSPVIRVRGICYVRQGASSHLPDVTEIDAAFDNCEVCARGDSSSQGVSNTACFDWPMCPDYVEMGFGYASCLVSPVTFFTVYPGTDPDDGMEVTMPSLAEGEEIIILHVSGLFDHGELGDPPVQYWSDMIEGYIGEAAAIGAGCTVAYAGTEAEALEFYLGTEAAPQCNCAGTINLGHPANGATLKFIQIYTPLPTGSVTYAIIHRRYFAVPGP